MLEYILKKFSDKEQGREMPRKREDLQLPGMLKRINCSVLWLEPGVSALEEE